MEGEMLRNGSAMTSPARLCSVHRQWNDFEGIGLKLSHTGTMTYVYEVRRGSPGFRAGLNAGDVIVEIDGENVEGWELKNISTKVRNLCGQFSILVTDKVSYERLKEQEITISSTMSNLEVITTAAKPTTFHDVGILLEKKIGAYMATTTPRNKYLAEVLLRVPLLFFAHFLFVLSPWSEYFLVDLVLCVIRYFGAFIAFGMWGLPVHKLATIYSLLAMNMLVTWLTEKTYWTFQNEASGACHDVWLPWSEESWWAPALATFTLQAAHLLFFCNMYDVAAWLGLPLCAVLFIPYWLCTFNIGLYYIAPILYWFYKSWFWVSFAVEVLTTFDLYIEKDGKFQIPPLPGKWFVRDMLAIFCVLYYLCCVAFDLTLVRSLTDVLSFSYLTAAVGVWCTSFMIIIALGAFMSIVANGVAALSLWLIKGEFDLLDVLNSTLGQRVNLTLTTYCIEAGILSAFEDTRVYSMESVLFLSLYVMVLQAWDLTENHLLFVVNSGDNKRWLAYLRVILFSFTILTVPTFCTVYIAPNIEVDLWLLMFVSGNISLLVRGAIVAVEITLVSVSWYIDNGLDRFEDVIYYVRVFKTTMTVLGGVLTAYHRLRAPFFKTWYFTRAMVIVCDVSIVIFTVTKREWASYQARRLYLHRVQGLPDATTEEIAEHDDVCSVCFAPMTAGKKLPCGHMFHTNCLRKWFQIRTSCPLCNTIIFAGIQS